MADDKFEPTEAHLESGSIASKSQSPRDVAADEAQRVDLSLSLKDSFRYYWKAVAWSLAMSMSTIMESYVLLLINSFFAFPQFQEAYGEQLPDGSWSIPARWQIALTVVVNVGMIVGVLGNGYCADRWGLRKVMFVSHVALIAFIFINFFAPSVEVLVVGTLMV